MPPSACARSRTSAGPNGTTSLQIRSVSALSFRRRDEQEHLERALTALLELDYPNYEVIAVDDRSSDETGAIMDRLTATHPNGERLRVIHVPSLPDGWLGKPHAMWTAAQQATGDWLLFTDADIHFRADVLRRAANYAEKNCRRSPGDVSHAHRLEFQQKGDACGIQHSLYVRTPALEDRGPQLTRPHWRGRFQYDSPRSVREGGDISDAAHGNHRRHASRKTSQGRRLQAAQCAGAGLASARLGRPCARYRSQSDEEFFLADALFRAENSGSILSFARTQPASIHRNDMGARFGEGAVCAGALQRLLHVRGNVVVFDRSRHYLCCCTLWQRYSLGTR